MRHPCTLCRALGPTYPLDARLLRDVQPYERSTSSPTSTHSSLILQTLQATQHREARDNAPT